MLRKPLHFVHGAGSARTLVQGPVAHTVTRGQLTGLWHGSVGERQLPLHEIAIHPYDAVSTHDRVDGVRLQCEGLCVGACDSSAREEVETPLARMAVNHAHRSCHRWCPPFPGFFLHYPSALIETLHYGR